MEGLFNAHKKLTKKDFSNLWESGLFVFDTNVLLDLYRLPKNARENLFEILSDSKINNRIWLPFQVALEFTYNRLEVISDQKSKFNSVKSIIESGKTNINSLKSQMLAQIQELQLKKRHSVITPDTHINENLFKETIQKLDGYLKILDDQDSQQPDVTDDDALRDKIENLFSNKIGKCFSNEELDAIYKEGESRYKDQIPPGFKDQSKTGFHLYEDKKILRKFGDLIFWKEIVLKAKNDKLKYVALISGDTKKDWWNEERGKKVGPKYELLNEIYFTCKELKMFHLYDTSQFMKYSNEYLKIQVNPQSIQETKDVIEFNRFNEELATDIKDSIIKYKNDLLAETELERFIKALFSDNYSSRTIRGINVETGIGKERVKELLDHLVDHGFARRWVGWDGKDYWELQENPIKIYSAAYRWPDGFVDVTDKIVDLVSKEIYSGLVDPSTFGISDPSYGNIKTLVIHCRIRGKVKSLSFNDGQLFKIE